jgi:hypothetical protein
MGGDINREVYRQTTGNQKYKGLQTDNRKSEIMREVYRQTTGNQK